MRDFEQEQRERVLRYQHRNIVRLRVAARNRYRIKAGIPLDAPLHKTSKIQYGDDGKLLPGLTKK